MLTTLFVALSLLVSASATTQPAPAASGSASLTTSGPVTTSASTDDLVGSGPPG